VLLVAYLGENTKECGDSPENSVEHSEHALAPGFVVQVSTVATPLFTAFFPMVLVTYHPKTLNGKF
jgi:hypothetical protein